MRSSALRTAPSLTPSFTDSRNERPIADSASVPVPRMPIWLSDAPVMPASTPAVNDSFTLSRKVFLIVTNASLSFSHSSIETRICTSRPSAP